ncbi:3'-5' exonuclease [Rhizobiaceae bacterium BDR2-2]|uniref:DNA-directed DNA polymerase n=1 Tax=Ectorhizobium quercum TaxID=2965071 RepID=A0AAE3SVH8_9HYPH|nr:3'-5' exonuclease [Ectorhizobium quercum]MCX8998345.1 3'-5' exonuclease [Ectorhizobium quercum]
MGVRLGLRIRILLFFVAIAAGVVAMTALGLFLARSRMEDAAAFDALVQGAIVAVFGMCGLIAWIWLLFDTHVARPIEAIASAMRARLHADIAAGMDPAEGRYLGDLAAAASATAARLAEDRNATAESIARETARLSADKRRLEHLLADVPPAVLLCTGRHRLVFYNGVARQLLVDAGQPVCLDRSLLDYLGDGAVRQAHRRLVEAGSRQAVIEFAAATPAGSRRLAARMRLAADNGGDDGAYVMTLRDMTAEIAGSGQPGERDRDEPLHDVVYDFDLLARAPPQTIAGARIEDLTYVVFDTETTGLLPDQGDEVVQIAAVRIVAGKRVRGEAFDMLVNPGRPIPPGATAIHGITDAMVAGAPRILDAVERFHRFAEGAVLVAHNAPFDMAFLRRRERQIGRRFDNPVLDTVLLSAAVFGRGEEHSLDALAARLGVDLPAERRHTAMGDAEATADAFLKLTTILAGKGLTRFGDVLAEARRHGRLAKDPDGTSAAG